MLDDRTRTNWLDQPISPKAIKWGVIATSIWLVLFIGLSLLIPEERGEAIVLALVPLLYIGSWWSLRSVARAIRKRERVPPRLIVAEIAVLTAIPLFAFTADFVLGSRGLWLAFCAVCIPGFYLLTMGRIRRIGITRHCARCEYEFNHPSHDDAPIRCPECDHAWLHDLAIGRRVGSRPRRIAGAAILILSALGMFSSVGFSSFLTSLVPTSVLIQFAGSDPYRSFKAWNQLKARTLTAAQELQLAELVLNNRRPGYPWSDAGAFLESVHASGLMPAAMEQRYFDGMFTVRLNAPRSARANEPFTIRLTDGVVCDSPARMVKVYFAGFGIDDGPLLTRREDALPGNLVGSTSDRPETLASVPTIIHTIATPGQHTLKAVLWVTVASQHIGPITWNPDGTPALPPTVLWSKRLQLTQPITITP